MRITLPFTLFLLVNFSGVVAEAQPDYTSTSYTHELSPFKVSLTVVGMEDILTPVTAGLLFEGQLKDKIFYNFQFRQGYIRNFMIPKSDLITTQKESKGTVFEAGIDLPFSDRIKPGRVKVTTSLDFSYDRNNLLEKYFKADCDVRKYWAFNGGIMYYNRPEYINSDSALYIISGNENIKAPKDQFTHFNQSTLGFYAGIAKRKIKKALVKNGDVNYGVYYSTKFYAQVFIGNTSIGDIVYNNQPYKIDNAVQMPLGYRIGWQWDQNGVVTGFEFGKMPGVKLETPVEQSQLSKIFVQNPFLNYARLTIHFTLFNGDKRYGM